MPTRVEVTTVIKSGKVTVMPGEYILPLDTAVGAIIQKEIRGDSAHVRVLGTIEAVAEAPVEGDGGPVVDGAEPKKPRSSGRSRT